MRRGREDRIAGRPCRTGHILALASSPVFPYKCIPRTDGAFGSPQKRPARRLRIPPLWAARRLRLRNGKIHRSDARLPGSRRTAAAARPAERHGRGVLAQSRQGGRGGADGGRSFRRNGHVLRPRRDAETARGPGTAGQGAALRSNTRTFLPKAETLKDVAWFPVGEKTGRAADPAGAAPAGYAGALANKSCPSSTGLRLPFALPRTLRALCQGKYLSHQDTMYQCHRWLQGLLCRPHGWRTDEESRGFGDELRFARLRRAFPQGKCPTYTPE